MTFNYLMAPPADNQYAQATWAFEHAMAHRTFLGALHPLDRFSVIPYFIDPPLGNNPKWKLNHQQAHMDFMFNLPPWYGFPTVDSLGIQVAHNLLDYDLSDADQLTWWTFANEREHYSGRNSMALEEIEFPFW